MDESYDFCNYLDSYITTESWLSSGSNSLRYTYYCEFSFDDSLRNNDLAYLCGKFKNLYDLVFVPFDDHISRNNEDSQFINYWLNRELKNKNISSISAPNFYKKLIAYDNLFDAEERLKDKIHDIKGEDLEKINTLYDMYDIYNNIKTTYDEEYCKSYSAQCVQKFKDAIESCSDDKNGEYYKALKSFKQKYEQLNEDNIFGVCKKEYLSTLPSLGEESLYKASAMESEADTSEQEPLQEQRKDQNLETKNDVEEEGQASKYTIEPPFPTTVENHNDNNISKFTIFGIILSISVFSIITYKVKYITNKNNNI